MLEWCFSCSSTPILFWYTIGSRVRMRQSVWGNDEGWTARGRFIFAKVQKVGQVYCELETVCFEYVIVLACMVLT